MKGLELMFSVICVTALYSCSPKNKEQKVSTVVPVRVWNVQSVSEMGSRSYVGTVEESYSSQLSFSSIGTVANVCVDEGCAVTKGQTLAILDKATVMNTYQIARSTLKQAEDAYHRLSILYKKGSLAEVKYVEIQTQLAQAQASERIARKSITDCVLRAPFAGYISKRSIDVGNNVIPGQSCFELVKLDKVKIKISIPEKEISSIRRGQKIRFTVAALDNRSFTGVVTEKGVQANPLSHTYEIRVELTNPNHLLLPGMVCNASIATQGLKAVVVPQQAVLIDEASTFVWVENRNTAHKRIVHTKGVNNSGVIITEGLESGDQVIVDGQENVSEGTKIKVL